MVSRWQDRRDFVRPGQRDTEAALVEQMAQLTRAKPRRSGPSYLVPLCAGCIDEMILRSLK
jgi:hypothetical protein